jgi:drug/metabolite transporter (DMT)-like permease
VLAISQAAGLVAVAAAVTIRGDGPPSDSGFAVWAALGGIAGAAGLAAFYRGLVVGAMSIVAPVSATAAVIPVAVGVATGERPSAIQAVGVALAILGVAAASSEGVGNENGAATPSITRRRRATGIPLALLAAAGFGAFFVGLDAAANEGEVLWAMLVARIASGSLLVAAALVLRPPLEGGRSQIPALVAIGLLDVSANLLFAVASTLGFVSIVGVLASLYPVITIFLARAVLRERIDRVQEVGVAGALGGVALIAAG